MFWCSGFSVSKCHAESPMVCLASLSQIISERDDVLCSGRLSQRILSPPYVLVDWLLCLKKRRLLSYVLPLCLFTQNPQRRSYVVFFWPLVQNNNNVAVCALSWPRLKIGYLEHDVLFWPFCQKRYSKRACSVFWLLWLKNQILRRMFCFSGFSVSKLAIYILWPVSLAQKKINTNTCPCLLASLASGSKLIK